MTNPDIDTSHAEVERIDDDRVDVNLNASGSYWRLRMSSTGVNLSGAEGDGDGLVMTRGEAMVLGRELLRFAIKGHLKEEY